MTQREHLPEVLPAPPESGAEVRPVAGRGTSAPEGVPGRRVIAFLLAALGIVLLPAGLLVFGLSTVPGYFTGWAAGWIGIAAVVWLVDSRTPRRWPGWALLASVPQAFVNVLFAAPIGLISLVAVAASPALATLACRRFAQPAKDLAELDVEIPVPLDAHGSGRLLIGRDRIVLAQTARGSGGRVRQALPLAELALAQPGEIGGGEDGWWPLPGGAGIRLRRGPALRLVAGMQQWIVHVADPQLVASIVRRRATAAWPLRTGPQDSASWHRLRTWAVARMTTVRRGRQAQAYPEYRALLGSALAVFGSMLLTTAIGRGVGDPVLWIVAVVVLGSGVLLAVGWLRVRRRLDQAELHQLPPGSPPWGDLRPDHAPIPNWRPFM
ncbi:hypothetical protein [Saccharopolyspora pogona]|uniref:hypothetical protein n=1 Tax=Saccharopolyspora pogona TaxID=333966 RepID=UPI001686A2BB|nr:hypothetical protein [Saccharopolyspora pogona]